MATAAMVLTISIAVRKFIQTTPSSVASVRTYPVVCFSPTWRELHQTWWSYSASSLPLIPLFRLIRIYLFLKPEGISILTINPFAHYPDIDHAGILLIGNSHPLEIPTLKFEDLRLCLLP